MQSQCPFMVICWLKPGKTQNAPEEKRYVYYGFFCPVHGGDRPGRAARAWGGRFPHKKAIAGAAAKTSATKLSRRRRRTTGPVESVERPRKTPVVLPNNCLPMGGGTFHYFFVETINIFLSITCHLKENEYIGQSPPGG